IGANWPMAAVYAAECFSSASQCERNIRSGNGRCGRVEIEGAGDRKRVSSDGHRRVRRKSVLDDPCSSCRRNEDANTQGYKYGKTDTHGALQPVSCDEKLTQIPCRAAVEKKFQYVRRSAYLRA